MARTILIAFSTCESFCPNFSISRKHFVGWATVRTKLLTGRLQLCPFPKRSPRTEARSVMMLCQTRTQAQKDAKGYWIGPVSGIEYRGFAVKSDIRAQTELPCLVLKKIAHATECVCADAVRRMDGCLGKQFIFVDQLQPRVCIVAAHEVDGGFEQVTVQVHRGEVLMLAAPNERRCPVAV